MSHQPNNIFAGTQVVALLEVRGPNNSLVHPRGAVGVVTRTPAVTGEKYLVRFPDGFEASFESAQLEVLKHFKDRLGEVGRVTPCAPQTSPKNPNGARGVTRPALRFTECDFKFISCSGLGCLAVCSIQNEKWKIQKVIRGNFPF